MLLCLCVVDYLFQEFVETKLSPLYGFKSRNWLLNMRYLGAVKLSVANFFCQKSVVDEITTSIKGVRR